jgi:glycosyltransferase involved in cell wall biosynthesis
MKTDKRTKVLFLPKWYPNRSDSMLGLFVRRHAIAVSQFADVSVLSVVLEENLTKLYEVESSVNEGLTEIIIYIKKYQSGFNLLDTIVNGYRYLTAHLAGWKILEQTDNKPDINHVHILTRAGVMALFFKIRYKTPFVVTEHWSRYLPHHQDGYSGTLRKKITEKVVNASAGITTVSTSLKEGMIAMGLHHQNWLITPNVIDTKLFQLNKNESAIEVFRFSHISCFEEQSKNMSGILRAAKKLKEQGRSFELIMIGDGPDWEQTKQYAAELDLSDTIRFTGVLENQDLVDEMSQCQCSILFSHYETFAIVIPENLSLGIPVIATNVGGIPEVLPREFGKLIPQKDENALLEAMVFMMDHYQEYKIDDMRNYVEENYSYEQVGKQFFDLYKSAL